MAENNVVMQISLNSGFIKGSVLYRKEIEKNFFSELIKNKLCEIKLLEENVYINEYYVNRVYYGNIYFYYKKMSFS